MAASMRPIGRIVSPPAQNFEDERLRWFGIRLNYCEARSVQAQRRHTCRAIA